LLLHTLRRASLKLGDGEKAQTYARQASEALSFLQKKWRTEDVNSYLARLDVRFLRGQLKEMLAENQ
jgi:hypothetical protein